MYEGGVQHGQGVIRYSSGHHYKGEFNNSKMEGEGVLTYKGNCIQKAYVRKLSCNILILFLET